MEKGENYVIMKDEYIKGEKCHEFLRQRKIAICKRNV